MPRLARTVFANMPHHITQRDNRREDIFDRRRSDNLPGVVEGILSVAWRGYSGRLLNDQSSPPGGRSHQRSCPPPCPEALTDTLCATIQSTAEPSGPCVAGVVFFGPLGWTICVGYVR